MKSRYIRTERRKLPNHRRSKQVYGSFEDSGKWFKCWNCGQMFDISKTSTGSGTGAGCVDFPVEDLSHDHSTIIGTDTQGMVGTIILNGPDDNPITDYYTPRKATVSAGCPLCGTKNLP